MKYPDKFWELLKGIAKSAELVIDIGSSAGSLPEYYYSPKTIVIAVDNNKELLTPAPRIKKVIADAQCLPFREVKADLIIAKYLLEHLIAPEKVVSQLRDLMNNNQFVYVVVPKYYAFQDSLYRLLGWCAQTLKCGKQAHISKFTFGSLCRLFYDNGFVLVDFYEADAGLSFLDKTKTRKKFKIWVVWFLKIFQKLFKKNLLERNEMHFIFCRFD